MSAVNRKKFVRISNHQVKKVSPRRLMNIFDAIGRRIFSRVHKNEVEYGQTLSKKRRKNCVLKSVSSLSYPEDENGFLLHSPYHINFKFSRDDTQYRGSVMNFQKINMGEESCCEKCDGTLRKGDSLSRFSVSSDSACDVSSESSCDDFDCKYRKSKVKKKKKKSVKVVTRAGNRTVENFIRIHRENFIDDVVEVLPEFRTNEENLKNSYWEWTDEPNYQSKVTKAEEPVPTLDDPEYDILVTKSGCRVLEPSYENLKLVENFYEMPQVKKSLEESPEKGKEIVQGNKTYDEVIESLKLWHLNPKYPEDGRNCSCCGERIENEFNHNVEGYESLENDFNNDIEEFCC